MTNLLDKLLQIVKVYDHFYYIVKVKYININTVVNESRHKIEYKKQIKYQSNMNEQFYFISLFNYKIFHQKSKKIYFLLYLKSYVTVIIIHRHNNIFQ